MHRCSHRGRRGTGLEGLALPPPPCGQLTRCFSAVTELLVFFTGTLSNMINIRSVTRITLFRFRSSLVDEFMIIVAFCAHKVFADIIEYRLYTHTCVYSIMMLLTACKTVVCNANAITLSSNLTF